MTNTETEQPGNSYNQVKKRSWFGTADAWTALATIGLIAVGIWGVIETRRALKLSERAWISPVAVAITAPLEEGKVIRFNVVLLNFGKEPALNVSYAFQNGIIKAPPPDDWSGIQVGSNKTCDGLKSVNGSQAILPSINGLGASRGEDSGQGADPLTATKAIIDGTFHYYVRGCVAYETFEETHTTGFCYVLQSKSNVPFNQMPFLSCPTGFEAN